MRSRDLGGTVAEAQRRIAENVRLPNGYRIEWAGEFEELQLAKRRLQLIVPISLALILALLYSLFNSLRDSLLALAGIPFAIAGGVLALYVTGLEFSISAAIGFVSLFGVSVMNGILVITYYNQVRAGGMDTIEAMFKVFAEHKSLAVQQTLFAMGDACRLKPEAGKQLFTSLGCSTCHRFDIQGRGPNLQNSFGKAVLLEDGRTVTMDENYVRESILRKVNVGWDCFVDNYSNKWAQQYGYTHIIREYDFVTFAK